MADRAEEITLFKSAAATFVELVAQVEHVSDWTVPGLGVWDLRALVGHTSRALITTLKYLDQPVDTETISSPEQYYVMAAQHATDAGAVAERGRQAGADLGAHPAQFVADLASRAGTRVDTADPDAVVAVLGGGMRVRNYLPTRVFELVVHSFDISTATGVGVIFTPAVLTAATELAAHIAVATGEGRTVLGALTGREPLPAGFSIVS